MRLRLLVPFVSALAGCTLYFGEPDPGQGPDPGWVPDAQLVTDAGNPWPVPDAAPWDPDGGCCPSPWPDAQPTCGNDGGQPGYPDAQPFYPDAQPIADAFVGYPPDGGP